MIKKALIVADIHDYLLEKLQENGYETILLNQQNDFNIPTYLPEIEGIITSNRLAIDQSIIDAAPNLKWIGRMGSGMEIIDVAYAKSKGIECFSSPEGNANAVAEQALGMLLCLKNNIVKSHIEIQNHQWLREENRGFEIEGKTAGIIGFGNNGSAFARKLNALGVKVLTYDKYKTDLIEPEIIVCKDLQQIYEQAEILSFHVPLTSETNHYFNDDFLNKMQQKFALLNISRGPVVSLKTLYQGIRSEQITAAALDVWEQEPYWETDTELRRFADELMHLPNFIGTPHIGGYSHEALYKMSFTLARKIFHS